MLPANAALLASDLLRAARTLCVLASGNDRLAIDSEILLREAGALLEERGRLLSGAAIAFS
jgi:hypothetical protein